MKFQSHASTRRPSGRSLKHWCGPGRLELQEKEGYGNELEELIGQFEALDQEKAALEQERDALQEHVSGSGEGQQRMAQDLQRLQEVRRNFTSHRMIMMNRRTGTFNLRLIGIEGSGCPMAAAN